jgi:maltose phosphorylase
VENGYPEYFAKVLNAPGLESILKSTVKIWFECVFQREIFVVSWTWKKAGTIVLWSYLNNGTEIAVSIRRFLSIVLDEVGVINYEITSLNKDSKIVYKPYIDAGVSNEDANWEEKF